MSCDVMATTTPMSSVPLRFLCKGPEYFRSTSVTSQSSDDRRLTATERLEADKLKYVKSARARQRRATCDFHACVVGRNTDSTGSHSAGSDSTISPGEDGDDVSDFVGNDVTTGARVVHGENLSFNLNRKQDQPFTDVIVRVKPHASRRPRPRPRSSTAGGIMISSNFPTEMKKEPCENYHDLVSDGNAITINLQKPQENSVTSNTSVHHPNQSEKTRQSRPVHSKPTYFRSSSVGAGTPRQQHINHDNPGNLKLPTNNNLVLSPRSQIRHVRQNLKKVSTKTDENRAFPESRQRGTALTISNRDETRGKSATITVKLRQHKPHRARPFSVIENINRFEFGASLQPVNTKPRDNKTAQNQVSMEQCSNGDRIPGNHGDISTADATGTSSACLMSGQHLKRRSLDLSHTIDTSLQLPFARPSALKFSQEVTDPDTTPTDPQREILYQDKPVVCSLNSSKPTRSVSKETQHEVFPSSKEPFQAIPCSSHNITDALEKILHPLDCDDEMDTGYNSMDASADSRTLVATPCQKDDTRKSTVASSINNALNGRTFEPEARKSVSSDSSKEEGRKNTYSRTPDNRRRYTHTDTSVSATVPRDRHWVNDKARRSTSQPFSRIDLAPNSSEHQIGTSQNSPMLAPRARKEVAPDYSVSGNTASLSRSGIGREEHFNTMKSHTTVTSASGDNNKPLTSLTASDLKPRRGGRVPHSTPVKPTCPYPVNNKASPKRQSSTPLSPTSSPNKQAVRTNPPHSARSASSTPYSSLKRNPAASRSSSLKRNRQRSRSDVSTFQSELDHFFSSMGMDESHHSLYTSCECIGARVSSESDFSFAGASAYVRDGPDEPMEVDPATARLANVPAVSVIEKNARVMRWIMSCKKNLATSRSPRRAPPTPNARPHLYNQPIHHTYSNCAPPVPPRSYHSMATIMPKESNV